MKTITATFFALTFFAVSSYGQGSAKKSNYPYWTISKEIQRLQYKDFTPLVMTITTGNTVLQSSKGINRMNARPSDKQVIYRTGMPSYVISKGVARMQYEKNKGNQ